EFRRVLFRSSRGWRPWRRGDGRCAAQASERCPRWVRASGREGVASLRAGLREVTATSIVGEDRRHCPGKTPESAHPGVIKWRESKPRSTGCQDFARQDKGLRL